MKELILE
jgi:hypothetical protein